MEKTSLPMERKLREDALTIFKAAIRAVDSYQAVKDFLRREGDELQIGGLSLRLSEIGRIIVVGGGKASANMAKGAEAKLGDKITGGLVNTKYGHSQSTDIIKVNECGHPIPDEEGRRGAEEMLSLVRGAGEEDLVLCLLSGGGSALLPYPAPDVSLEDKQLTTQLLLKCGAAIEEINCLRKHLSGIKGGRLARSAYPAMVISLILSDVIGDRLDTIASGPTVPDPSTFQDAWQIIQKYNLERELPPSVTQHLQRGLRGEIPETPKAGEVIFARVFNFIVGNNFKALKAAEEKGKQLGYNTLILSSCVQGEAREIAKFYAALAKEIKLSHTPLPPPCLLISGGETTVTIRGEGKGGRNQEMALSFAQEIKGIKDVLFLSAGTDGTDGPTDAAGAFAEGDTLERGEQKGLRAREFLANNDSYHFFKVLGDLLITGPTGTNVMDLHLLLVGA